MANITITAVDGKSIRIGVKNNFNVKIKNICITINSRVREWAKKKSAFDQGEATFT